jgi:hypothetical protein
MMLFKPSEDLVKALFEHHKATRGIKRKELTLELIASIQEQIGYTFRRVLIEFAFKMLLERSGKERGADVASIAMIIDIGGNKFENGFDEILKNKLGIQDDAFGEGAGLISMLRKEFQVWLTSLSGCLPAEKDNWPYWFITALGHGGVSMDLNTNIDLEKAVESVELKRVAPFSGKNC